MDSCGAVTVMPSGTCYTFQTVTGQTKRQATTFGQRLQAAQGDLTNHQLAVRSGIEASTISRYRTDSIEPKLDNIRKLARALDRPVSYFVDDQA